MTNTYFKEITFVRFFGFEFFLAIDSYIICECNPNFHTNIKIRK